jgi:hypothetical protein
VVEPAELVAERACRAEAQGLCSRSPTERGTARALWEKQFPDGPSGTYQLAVRRSVNPDDFPVSGKHPQRCPKGFPELGAVCGLKQLAQPSEQSRSGGPGHDEVAERNRVEVILPRPSRERNNNPHEFYCRPLLSSSLTPAATAAYLNNPLHQSRGPSGFDMASRSPRPR